MRLARLALAAALLAGSAGAATPGFHVIDRIAAPDGGWDYVSVDAAHDRALIARRTTVTAVDLKTKAVTPEFATASRGHTALAVNDGKEVLITNGSADTAVFVDAMTGATIASVATGKGPDAATVDPRSGLLLIMDHAGGEVTLIDPKTHTAVASIPVEGKLEGAAVDGAGRAFVNVEDKNQIAVIDLAAHKVVARYALPGCDGPTGIVDAGGKLAAACDGAVVLVDPKTGKVLQTAKTGGGADGIAYDPAHKRLFVPAGDAGNLAVFSLVGGKLKLEETIPTEVGARTIAFDPASGHALLPSAQMAMTNGKRTATPGTFHLLVVGQ